MPPIYISDSSFLVSEFFELIILLLNVTKNIFSVPCVLLASNCFRHILHIDFH